jgi:hypothetical protein
MLDVNPETVCAIVNKARQFHAKEQVVITEDPLNPSDDDWAMQVLADHADDMTFQEARANIADLEPDQQVQIVALMWLGRGDYEADEWQDAIEAAQDAWTEHTAEYLFAHPYLADHLLEGLDMLGYSCED